jgi:acyl-CoA synthetase (AMP-forming)/AMP-acid ligase II
MPDRRMGEVGLAVVVPSAETATAGDDLEPTLIAWTRERLANYKVPRSVVTVESLPLNASGKVLKRELRERFAPTT